MRFNDAIIGAVLVLLAVGIFADVSQFPSPPFSSYGPATFPKILAGALGVAGLLLVAQGIRARPREAMAKFDPWAGSLVRWRRMLEILIAVYAYTLMVGPLGFIPTTFLIAFLLMLDFTGKRIVTSAVVAAAFAIGSYIVFGSLLDLCGLVGGAWPQSARHVVCPVGASGA